MEKVNIPRHFLCASSLQRALSKARVEAIRPYTLLRALCPLITTSGHDFFVHIIWMLCYIMMNIQRNAIRLAE